MRKQELDSWIKNGGDLPENLTVDEKSYLKDLGWTIEENWWRCGQRSCERYMLHGKKHGKEEGWWPSGKKGYKYYWLHGEKHGMLRTWWNSEDGQIRAVECFHHGKKHGVWKKWNLDGTLVVHEEYAYGVFLKDFLK